MKFVYQYRTSDNVQHDGVISAPTRDAAFAALKIQGIRPGRMAECPGFFNKLLGKGKRWTAIGALSATVIILVVAYFSSEREVAVGYADREGNARPIARRQVWGNDSIVDNAAKHGWSDVFENQADRLLARFAQPGKPVERIYVPNEVEQWVDAALKSPIRIADDELEEFKQVKCMVAGMREELREYLKDGGSVSGFFGRLVERQNMEIGVVEHERNIVKAAIALKRPDLNDVWNKTNRKLRNMGLPVFPPPESF